MFTSFFFIGFATLLKQGFARLLTNKNPAKAGHFILFAEEEVLEPYPTSTDYQYFMIGKFLYSPEDSPNRLTANLNKDNSYQTLIQEAASFP